jgi:RNA polymerase sigma factor (sigma-70 family)
MMMYHSIVTDIFDQDSHMRVPYAKDNGLLKCPAGSRRLLCPSPATSAREPDITELAIQRCLNRLRTSGELKADRIVCELMSVSADRLQGLCKSILSGHYSRLSEGPLNLRSEELLSLVVERLIKAMQGVYVVHFRQFFALAVRHIRWELNGQARAIAGREYELLEADAVANVPSDDSQQLGPTARRILQAVKGLPHNHRQVFELVRLQGMSQVDAADVLGVSVKTVQRRLKRMLPYLCDQLRDLDPAQR